MKISKFFNTIEEATKENTFLKYMVILETIALILAFFILGGKETIIIQQPNMLTKDITFSEGSGDNTYKEQWALSFAELMGNVTPSNADFIKSRMGEYFSPTLYHEMKSDIEEQVLSLKKQQASINFLPKAIMSDPKNGIVYVNGTREIHSYGVNTKRSDWTLEFGIKVVNYLPVVDHFDSYKGQPKSSEKQGG